MPLAHIHTRVVPYLAQLAEECGRILGGCPAPGLDDIGRGVWIAESVISHENG